VVTSICRFLHVLDLGRLSSTARVWSSRARTPALWAHIDVIFRPKLSLDDLGQIVARAGASLRSIRLSSCAVVHASDVIPLVAANFRAAMDRGVLSDTAGLEVAVNKHWSGGNDEDDDAIDQLADCPVTVRVNGGVLGTCELGTPGVVVCGRRRLLRRTNRPSGKDFVGCDDCLSYCHICDRWCLAEDLETCSRCDDRFCTDRYCEARDDNGDGDTCKACGSESAVNIGWRCSGCSARTKLVKCDDGGCVEAYCVSCMPHLLKTCTTCCLRACRYDCFANVHAGRWRSCARVSPPPPPAAPAKRPSPKKPMAKKPCPKKPFAPAEKPREAYR